MPYSEPEKQKEYQRRWAKSRYIEKRAGVRAEKYLIAIDFILKNYLLSTECRKRIREKMELLLEEEL